MPLDQLATIGAGLVVIVGGIVAYVRWFLPRYQRLRGDVTAGRDALLGRDEVLDSITGKVLSPALPGMGVRMDRNEEQGRRQEEQMAVVIEAVAQIAPALTQLADSRTRQEATDKTLAEHAQQLADQARQVERNANDIAALRDASMERIASRIDSASAFKAIEAIASNPNEEHK